VHSILSKIDKKFHKMEYYLLMCAGLTIFFIMFLVTTDVIMRNVFNKPLIGVFEIVSMLLVGIIAFGFAYVQGENEHIVVEIATNSWPQLYKDILDFISCMIGLVVVSIIAWNSLGSLQTSYLSKEFTMGLIRLPIWPSKLLLSVGLGVLAIRLLIDSLYVLTKLVLGEQKSIQNNQHSEEIDLSELEDIKF
jgi:TRAP-type C4-dicarboxylate transport system permease small subunit